MSDPYGTDAALQRIQENQFRKGKSGNPAGRPKGSRNMKTIVQEAANEQHTFREDGIGYKLSTAELLLKSLQRAAINGNLQATKKLDSIDGKFGLSAAVIESGGYLVVPEGTTEETTDLLIEDVEDDGR